MRGLNTDGVHRKITNYGSKITWTGNADYKNIDPKMQLDETTNIIASFN
ncbi:hypothetical protein H9N25_01270 [Pedobacter riviphilus]|uniref:Uncharacterized protein n=1 Tax=Pedobacter riviphilus TaxID=2766984 RepID=A0ABX6TJU0_9SPHI|nr:hypothetical protein [Pedobacter riviphilus]QNR85166.1 hypothetical protein H9N25_01270 [Pedobacter riviphilus]